MRTRLGNSVLVEATIDRGPLWQPKLRKEKVSSLAKKAAKSKPQVPSSSDERDQFRSNLLSLVSHELRTPLTGIINSISLLEEYTLQRQGDWKLENPGDFSDLELVRMARRNAQSLQYVLSSLLDLASMDAGAFHLRLREVSLVRLMRRKCEENAKFFSDESVKWILSELHDDPQSVPVLVDPNRISRAMDLIFRVIANTMNKRFPLHVETSLNEVQFKFTIENKFRDEWEEAWQAENATSLFEQAQKTQEEFLARTREGLGSEINIVFQTIQRHQGEAKASMVGNQASLKISLPKLNSIESLKTILESRIYEMSTELSSVALGLVAIPKNESPERFQKALRKSLFRASDASYLLQDEGVCAIILNDCKKSDAPKLIARIEKVLDTELQTGVVTCPDEGADPDFLLELARKRLGNI